MGSFYSLGRDKSLTGFAGRRIPVACFSPDSVWTSLHRAALRRRHGVELLLQDAERQIEGDPRRHPFSASAEGRRSKHQSQRPMAPVGMKRLHSKQ